MSATHSHIVFFLFQEKELAVCSPDCKKADDLLSERQLTIKEILLELSNDGVAFTAIPNDEPSCTSFLQEKYEGNFGCTPSVNSYFRVPVGTVSLYSSLVGR